MAAVAGSSGLELAAAMLAAAVQAGASRHVVAAAAAALWRLAAEAPQATAEMDEDVKALVDDRLSLLKPVFTVQTLFAIQTGESRHTARGLVSHESMCMANEARHTAFDSPKPLSQMALGEVRRRQRGGRKADGVAKHTAERDKELCEDQEKIGSVNTIEEEINEAIDDEKVELAGDVKINREEVNVHTSEELADSQQLVAEVGEHCRQVGEVEEIFEECADSQQCIAEVGDRCWRVGAELLGKKTTSKKKRVKKNKVQLKGLQLMAGIAAVLIVLTMAVAKIGTCAKPPAE